MKCWEELIKEELLNTNEDLEDIVWSISVEERKKEFDHGDEGPGGCPFTAWGLIYVYFPICYDGAEWVGSAPRNPCDVSMKHQRG